MKQLIVKKTLEINAPVSKVWDTLTNRDLTSQYMFGCELIMHFFMKRHTSSTIIS